MSDISDEERAERQRAIDFARGSTQLSEGALDPEVEALNTRYFAGELSGDEHVAAMIAHARTFSKGEPAQEYFTSAEDAMKATPGR